MKFTIVALGSRGDTQPYLAIACGLKQAGYDVRFCAGDNFREFVESYDIPFVPIGVDIQEFIHTRIPKVLESGRNTFQALRKVVGEGLSYADTMWEGIQVACEDADAIGINFMGIGAYPIATVRQIPIFMLHTTPLIGRTQTAPPMIFPIQQNFGKLLNGALHDLSETFLQLLLRPGINSWRGEVGLTPLPYLGWRFDAMPDLTIPMIYGHSPSVLPRPDDWQPHWHVSGYWFLDEPDTWQPPSDLCDFLEAGDPPVYIGFGSMSGRKPEEMTRLVLDALELSGQRGVIASGWGGLSQDDLPDTVYALESIPHSWLFSRMAAVVHHGGAGTTAAGLRAGVPTVVIPHFGDQQYWGLQTERLGVGLEPIPRSELTVERLAGALQEAAESQMLRYRASKLGERIRAENGVQTTIELMERYIQNR